MVRRLIIVAQLVSSTAKNKVRGMLVEGYLNLTIKLRKVKEAAEARKV
jgi:hypothetical protein